MNLIARRLTHNTPNPESIGTIVLIVQYPLVHKRKVNPPNATKKRIGTNKPKKNHRKKDFPCFLQYLESKLPSF